MSTQRPFFYNFLAAFRVHHALKAPTTTSATSTPGTTAALSTVAAAASSFPTPIPRTTTPEPIPMTTAAAAAAAVARTISSPQQHKSSTLVSAFSPPTTTTHTHTQSHHARRTSNNPVSRSPAFTSPATHRRGSDSSSDGGFRDTLGGEKWFIGGRTPLGEERFYRLTMARRERSNDRASLDRMSL